jgi:hypothetical protein
MVGNQPNQLARFLLDALNVSNPTHDLLMSTSRLLPKFDLDNSEPLEDRIKKLIEFIEFLNVRHKDVVCLLFPYTLKNKSYTWYYNLVVGCMTSWT